MKKKVFALFILFASLFYSGKILAAGCPGNASFDELSQSCQCKSGYAMIKNECMTMSQYCTDSFGANSSYDATNNKCKCDYGYVAVSGRCINANLYCQDKSGTHSSYNSDSKSCVCEEGYVLFENNCIDGDKYCRSKSGSNSGYDIVSKACICEDNYELKDGRCVTVEIINILPSKGAIGDLIKIQGNNLGIEEQNYLYIGSVLVNLSDIVSWSDKQIVFRVQDYMASGDVVLKTDAGLVFTGPYFEISQPDVASEAGSAEVTLNQQINITGATEPATATNSTNSISKTTTSTTVEKQQPGVFSFLSSFTAGLLNGIKHFFSVLFS